MLFKTIEEFKDHVSVNESMAIESLNPDIRRAEKEYLIPYIGQDQYDDLEQLYQDGDMLEKHERLIEYCRDVVAMFTMHNYLPLQQLQMSDIGVHIHSTDSQKTAWQWQIDDLDEKYFLRLGYTAIDCLMEMMETYIEDYPLWAESDNYKANKNLIINTTSDFNAHYFINKSYLTFQAFVPLMKKVEQFEIYNAIGKETFDRIKAEIAAHNVTEEITDLMQWLKPAIAHFTVIRALKALPVTLRHDGVVLNSYTTTDENARERKAADAGLLNRATYEARSAHAFMLRLTNYLDANATEDLYPEYYAYKNPEVVDSASTDEEVVPTRKFFTFGM
jgi:hypothetical protein